MDITHTTNQHPYHFVPEPKREQFERIAVSVYLDAARKAKHFPVLSRVHFFRNDEYGIAEALYDFANELFVERLEKYQVYPGKIGEWNEEIWDEVDADLLESLGYLESVLLDDIYEHWNRNQMIFIDEHRTMSEEVIIRNCAIQGVW